MKAMRIRRMGLAGLVISAMSGLGAAPVVDHEASGGESTVQGAPPKGDPAIATWEDDVLDILNALKGKATSSNQIIAGRTGSQLSTSERATLNLELDVILQHIAEAQVPISANDPGLSTPGNVDTSISPQTLAEYASIVEALSSEAHAAVTAGPGFERAYVGTRLKTIYSLITRSGPHSFRSKLTEN